VAGIHVRYVVISLIQTAGVILLAVSGVLIGRRFWRGKGRAWIVAYAVPLLLLATIVTSRRLPQAELIVPFKWIMAGRTEFALLAVICTVLLTTPISRLPRRRDRRAVMLCVILFTAYFSVLPFLMPAIEYSRLARLETTIDTNGVCRQSTVYNCGPAAAVTVLRSLAVPAEEGELALRAYATRFTGAPMDSLCDAMRDDYGIPCRIVYCRDVIELRGRGPFVAIVKFSFLVDHYVAVMSVTENKVTIGDPLTGLRMCTPEEFNKEWRRCAIVIDRE
jgi:hypothetical protein